MTTRHHISYFRVFREIAKAILSVLDSKEVLRIIVTRIVPAMKVKAASLRLINEDTNDLELVASHRLSIKYLNKGLPQVDKSIPEVLEGKPVLIVDAQNDPRIQYPREKVEEGIASILSVPVQIHHKVIGVLRLYTRSPRSFSEEEIEFVSAVGEMAGLAIINARRYQKEREKLTKLLKEGGIEPTPAQPIKTSGIKPLSKAPLDHRRSAEFFRMLHEVSRELLSDLNSHKVLDSITDKMIHIMGIKGCCIYLLNETTGKLELMASRGLSKEYLQKGPIDAEKSIPAVTRGRTVYIRNVAADKNIQYRNEAIKEGISAILSVPIFVSNRVIGEIRLYSGEDKGYGKDELEFVTALSEICGIAITNTRFYQRVTHDIQFWKSTLTYLKGAK